MLDEKKVNISTILSNSTPNNYLDNIEKIELLKKEFLLISNQIENLVIKCNQLTPFKLRRQKLKYPYNKCKCLIPYKRSQISLDEDEECTIEDNTQRIKWKVVTKSGQTSLVPSVCFVLPPVDEDSLDLVNQ